MSAFPTFAEANPGRGIVYRPNLQGGWSPRISARTSAKTSGDFYKQRGSGLDYLKGGGGPSSLDYLSEQKQMSLAGDAMKRRDTTTAGGLKSVMDEELANGRINQAEYDAATMDIAKGSGGLVNARNMLSTAWKLRNGGDESQLTDGSQPGQYRPPSPIQTSLGRFANGVTQFGDNGDVMFDDGASINGGILSSKYGGGSVTNGPPAKSRINWGDTYNENFFKPPTIQPPAPITQPVQPLPVLGRNDTQILPPSTSGGQAAGLIQNPAPVAPPFLNFGGAAEAGPVIPQDIGSIYNFMGSSDPIGLDGETYAQDSPLMPSPIWSARFPKKNPTWGEKTYSPDPNWKPEPIGDEVRDVLVPRPGSINPIWDERLNRKRLGFRTA